MEIITDERSPYHSSRRGRPISMIVVHATVGGLWGTIGWFQDNPDQVSSNVVIGKDGTIYEMVPDRLASNHAGTSYWNGWNSYEIKWRSLGVELENLTGRQRPRFYGQDPYPQVQIDALTEYCREKKHEYQIDPSNIVRHLDIAPGRKSDPAGFPWTQWKSNLLDLRWEPRWYRVTGDRLLTREGPSTTFPVALQGNVPRFNRGDVFLSDNRVEGEYIQGTNLWAHRSDGLGFVSMAFLEEV